MKVDGNDPASEMPVDLAIASEQMAHLQGHYEGRNAARADEAFVRTDALMAKHNRRQAPERPQVIPCLDYDKPDNMGPVFEGLDHWNRVRVTDTAIIIDPTPDGAVCKQVCDRYPDLKIIPGVKTRYCLSDGLGDSHGWDVVARQVQVMADIAGSTRVYLDMEDPFKTALAYPDSCEVTDGFLAVFREGLRRLSADIEEVWFWPDIAGSDRAYMNRSEDLIECVHKALGSRLRLIGNNRSQPGTIDYKWCERAEALNKYIVGAENLIQKLYFYGDAPTPSWPDDALPEVLRKYCGNRAIIYPGGRRWPEASRILVEILERSF
jgi:hypothetical protein